jgi:hypothetical protein
MYTMYIYTCEMLRNINFFIKYASLTIQFG